MTVGANRRHLPAPQHHNPFCLEVKSLVPQSKVLRTSFKRIQKERRDFQATSQDLSKMIWVEMAALSIEHEVSSGYLMFYRHGRQPAQVAEQCRAWLGQHHLKLTRDEDASFDLLDDDPDPPADTATGDADGEETVAPPEARDQVFIRERRESLAARLGATASPPRDWNSILVRMFRYIVRKAHEDVKHDIETEAYFALAGLSAGQVYLDATAAHKKDEWYDIVLLYVQSVTALPGAGVLEAASLGVSPHQFCELVRSALDCLVGLYQRRIGTGAGLRFGLYLGRDGFLVADWEERLGAAFRAPVARLRYDVESLRKEIAALGSEHVVAVRAILDQIAGQGYVE